jgi:hypothetical protein
MSAFGTKRTSLFAAQMSAFDPKRTFRSTPFRNLQISNLPLKSVSFTACVASTMRQNMCLTLHDQEQK